jgi:very-short-patch-repair endonuclease
MRPEHWRAITQIATGQDGLVTASQLRLTGASPAAIEKLVRRGQLLPVRNRVLAVAGVPTGASRPIRAVALVSPHAVVSHRSAAWLWRLLAQPPRLIEVTVPLRVEVDLQGVTSCPAKLGPGEHTKIDGIAVTSVPRTLADLTTVLTPDWVERLVHDAVMRKLCEYNDVIAALDRAGAERVRAALTDAVGTTPLEAKWHQLLCTAGLRPPARQHQIVLDGQVYVLDFAWPEHRVAVEANGFAPHRTRTAFDRDHDKVLALKRAGWEVIGVTARTKPDAVIPLLRTLLR